MKLKYLSAAMMFGLALGFEVSTSGASYGAAAYSKTITLSGAKSPEGKAYTAKIHKVILNRPETKVKPANPALLGAPAPVGAAPRLRQNCDPSMGSC